MASVARAGAYRAGRSRDRGGCEGSRGGAGSSARRGPHGGRLRGETPHASHRVAFALLVIAGVALAVWAIVAAAG